MGVCLTASRAGIVAWLIAAVGLLSTQAVRPKQFLLYGSACLLVTVLIFLPVPMNSSRHGTVRCYQSQHFGTIGMVCRPIWNIRSFELGTTVLAKQAWDKIADSPAFGAAPGPISMQ